MLVRGVVVLFEGDLPQHLLPQDVYARLEDRSWFMLRHDKPNACFALKSLKRRGTYIGIIPAGFTRWILDGKSLRIPLFRSPDSGAEVTLTGSPAVMRGRSHEYGLAGDEGTVAFVLARRRGPPNVHLCVQAGAT